MIIFLESFKENIDFLEFSKILESRKSKSKMVPRPNGPGYGHNSQFAAGASRAARQRARELLKMSIPNAGVRLINDKHSKIENKIKSLIIVHTFYHN